MANTEKTNVNNEMEQEKTEIGTTAAEPKKAKKEKRQLSTRGKWAIGGGIALGVIGLGIGIYALVTRKAPPVQVVEKAAEVVTDVATTAAAAA